MTPRQHRTKDVYYPEGDGKPMAETEIHLDEMIRIIQTLRDAFAGRADVYVVGNLLLYYEEGNPRASVSPDAMVVLGVPKRPRRRTYKVWEEGAPPTVVFEVTSRSTRGEDLRRKRDLYERLGVREYFLYDPLAEYLRPALQGYRLEGGAYAPIATDAAGGLVSTELDIYLILVEGRLQLIDRPTGETLLSPPERAAIEAARAAVEAARADTEASRADIEANRADTEANRADAEANRADTEAAARSAAERRIAELEALLTQRSKQ